MHPNYLTHKLSLGLTLFALSSSAWSQQIAIDHYDINEAVLSGHGNWFHTYDGTITPGAHFVNIEPAGTVATYQFGSGTLNDGVVGGTGASQLFVTPAASDGTVIRPAIFLTLDVSKPWRVDKVEIYGGEVATNSIPGAITAVDVGVLGPTGGVPVISFNTTPFGPTQNKDGIDVNDLIDLSATPLASTPAWALVLSNFQGTVGNWFSISEIKVYGEPVATVPVPAAAWLMGSALAGLVGYGRRRGSNPIGEGYARSGD
ncbi:VPLPA-CTERM sorting domain-containing protein [Methylococcus sp. EFPC2]|uniref:VPLPA-CTERM sorting domain-containing protein n=1 Tax=Methylococcus sp. EFPC2 TaxID=2812648 RepID=UPI001967DF07|nr:VPLPA-CTERM sorting domain-containing protein [Methylococcus sp. EFPC2]QSA97142.1 VPLPA-CTERM sorting domain-containing protein [Methylococcus sp. EFPC2]